MRFVGISYNWLKEILSDGDHDLRHDWTAMDILTAPTDHWPLSFLDFCRVNTMAEVENNENMAFAISVYAFHIGGLIHLFLSRL